MLQYVLYNWHKWITIQNCAKVISAAKSTYKYFIKSYDIVINGLRYLYIYGCYSRDDCQNIGISGRKYDNECRRILYSIEREFINENFISNTKYIGFKYGMFRISQNFLVNSYLSVNIIL